MKQAEWAVSKSMATREFSYRVQFSTASSENREWEQAAGAEDGERTTEYGLLNQGGTGLPPPVLSLSGSLLTTAYCSCLCRANMLPNPAILGQQWTTAETREK
ncbi:hypothetical protein GUJ93_ZPchr0007g4830 [Zizania palustris]|uniref:Uncharacterized protein n=1 Tax=Zizania palustris TaxID=103762 RepID=A0A8J5SU11_ZIZPA|nr:hypothetical protein GUJ93_ZPchr0007g3577 [Zizania palustris]KAG8080405.1 hypothetical protein GUJ93_ZPchr0007g4830 [Zizania palustris]